MDTYLQLLTSDIHHCLGCRMDVDCEPLARHKMQVM